MRALRRTWRNKSILIDRQSRALWECARSGFWRDEQRLKGDQWEGLCMMIDEVEEEADWVEPGTFGSLGTRTVFKR